MLRITQHAASAKTIAWTNVDYTSGGAAGTVRWAGGGTAPTGFTDETNYFLIKSANSNKVLIASTRENALEGTNITIATGSGTGSGHTFIGETPTATATLGLGTPGTDTGGREIAHVGWVKRTVGTGGRAGRVHYETLVAASSITGDSEDLITPDS